MERVEVWVRCVGACFALLLAGSAHAAVGDEVWSFQTLGVVFGAPAVGADGTIYVGSRDKSVYAINADGSQKWAFATGDWVDGSPTLSHDETVVYVGSWDNRMYAISSATGEKLWEFETGSLVVSSPALDADGNLFFGSSDGFFYSLDPSGEVRWAYFVGNELDSSPAVGEDGSVYVGDFDGVLYSFSNAGVLRWGFSTRRTVDPNDQRIAGPVSIGENGEIYFGGGDGYCYALDAAGALIWEFDALDKVDTGVVIGNEGELIFASRNGYVYALDAFGVYEWSSYVGDVFFSTPAVGADGKIYLGSYIGAGVSALSVLDAAGEPVWDYLILDYIDSPPVIDTGGRVVFGGYDGAVYALDAAASPGLSAWNRFGGDRGNRSLRVPYVAAVLSERFEQWLGLLGLSGVFADPLFDADGDGKLLAFEYLLGGDVTQADGAGVRVGSELVDGELRAVWEYELIRGDAELFYAMEVSTDGLIWKDLAELDGAEFSVVSEDTYEDGWYETRRVYLPLGMAETVLGRARLSSE